MMPKAIIVVIFFWTSLLAIAYTAPSSKGRHKRSPQCSSRSGDSDHIQLLQELMRISGGGGGGGGGRANQSENHQHHTHFTPDTPTIQILNDDNFPSWINSSENKMALVLFYAWWCGYSQKFLPEFDKIAQRLKHDPVRLGKIDCSLVGQETCQKYQIKAYPTLHFFKNGVPSSSYSGQREEIWVVSYVRSQIEEEIGKDSNSAPVVDDEDDDYSHYDVDNSAPAKSDYPDEDDDYISSVENNKGNGTNGGRNVEQGTEFPNAKANPAAVDVDGTKAGEDSGNISGQINKSKSNSITKADEQLLPPANEIHNNDNKETTNMENMELDSESGNADFGDHLKHDDKGDEDRKSVDEEKDVESSHSAHVHGNVVLRNIESRLLAQNHFEIILVMISFSFLIKLTI